MRPATHREPVLASGVVFAFIVTVVVHVGLSLGMVYADSAVVHHTDTKNAKKQRRGRFGEVAYEPRRLELECSSIAECEPNTEPLTVELKVAKLGMKEPEPNKLPELQTYETPEIVEEAVNLEKSPDTVKPLPFKDFKARKKRLDRLRRKRPRKNPFKSAFDDDPRKRPTRFERITGRLDGNPYGKGVDQEKFDSYFAKVAFKMFRYFDVSTTLSKQVIRKQLVRVLITRMTEDGAIVSYRIKRRARKLAYTTSAEACIKKFMPSEGGTLRLPRPDAELLQFINKKGFLLDLDGRLLQ